nr:hypothetical protein [Campylobacter coli]
MKIYSKTLKIKELKNKTNSLVYKLYNLTEDEIKFIENIQN